MTLTFNLQRDIHTKNNGHLVQKIAWKETVGGTDTTDHITRLPKAVGKVSRRNNFSQLTRALLGADRGHLPTPAPSS